ncbi:hypothetical protein FD11_GL001070 [Ligilactobacillus pobuzihii E100301 = KCTC 13174]|uniref:beta-glucosidase n=4 Tax=Ligilactobacillus pobuzihii TaxID=449659 RepID=A0A0R2LH80_9LACO|nr:hypothetical protein FD11_GL001070 [Ligilactobacillus pobuzihii E100301 = KCTC 13174]KRO01157.1 hypothetical protein IV66_GL001125 [Ligilactobacillus pobuzihii]
MKIRYVQNDEGPELAYSSESGLGLIEKNGHYFKDHDRTGKLKEFEDWRLSPQKRAKDLAQRLSIEDIAGLMLFTSHLAIPSTGKRSQTYGGKEYDPQVTTPSELTDIQKEYFCKNRIKHTLVTTIQSPQVAAEWNNKVQSLSETMPWAIPIVNSTDPRHGYNSDAEFNEGSGGQISQWPESIGLAATFDPELARRFGTIASKEDRAMGISMYLGPQIDLGTEPRWMRYSGTFGESARLSSKFANAIVEGFQQTLGRWGKESVSTMAKHWPGGGVIEAGRDAHFAYGKYGVYPQNNQQYQLLPFISVLDKKLTDVDRIAGIMPYYSISMDFAPGQSENVGNAYSHYLITDLLRQKYQYDEVVCTDWCITADEPSNVVDILSGDQSWGVEENFTVAERHLKLLLAGVDQFGGNKDPEPILWAYQQMCKMMGKPWAEKRFRKSAMRILKNIFQLGLFENPYADIKRAEKIVGNVEFVAAGLEAQKKSIILLKNKQQVLPLSKGEKVFVPERTYPAQTGWYLSDIPSETKSPMNLDKIAKNFQKVERPEDSTATIVRIKSPERAFVRYNGYDPNIVSKDETGYLPISLQYRKYTASNARKCSLAGDRRPEHILNRTYRAKTIETINESDLDLVIETRKQIGAKPLIVSINTSNPFVIREIEPYADAILLDFGVDDTAILSILSGEFNPSGLLPFQMPQDMEQVERQSEDTAFDMRPYQDEIGNSYDFGFGMNFAGEIRDQRNRKFIKDR